MSIEKYKKICTKLTSSDDLYYLAFKQSNFLIFEFSKKTPMAYVCDVLGFRGWGREMWRTSHLIRNLKDRVGGTG